MTPSVACNFGAIFPCYDNDDDMTIMTCINDDDSTYSSKALTDNTEKSYLFHSLNVEQEDH